MLPFSFAEDEDRLSRFDREATTLVPQNHPATHEMGPAFSPDAKWLACFSDNARAAQQRHLADVSADGTRFVLLRPEDENASSGFTHVVIVIDFFDDVRRAVTQE